MAQQSFSASVDAWVRETQQRMDAVVKTSAQYVFEDVIFRTRVDTGYARASWTASVTAPVPMTGTQGDGYKAPSYVLVISGAQLGQSIYFTAVARYMIHLEYGARGRPGDGMVRLAAQNWGQHVTRAVAAAKARVAARG
jgi:hypothetical protein